MPKKGNAKECSNYSTIPFISHASKEMLKILQVRIQQFLNHELSYVAVRFRKGRGTKDQVAIICWIIEKTREFQKNIYSYFITYAKSLCVNHINLWKILKDTGISDNLTCLLTSPYAGQEATVRTWHGTTDWFKIGEEYIQAVWCHPVYLTSAQSASYKMSGWMKHKLESR